MFSRDTSHAVCRDYTRMLAKLYTLAKSTGAKSIN